MVSIREPALEHASALAEALNEDVQLRADLGIHGKQRLSAAQVLEDVEAWCRSRRAVSWAILADGLTVGMMSLSRIDPATGTGRIGYWVGSRYRRRGHCTDAFRLVLQEALRRGVRRVSATVGTGNAPSRRLWEAAGATAVSASAECRTYTLEIEPHTTSCPSSTGPAPTR